MVDPVNRFERRKKWILVGAFAACYAFFDLVVGSLLIPRVPRRFHPYYHHDLKTHQHYEDEKWGTHRYALITNSLGFKDSSRREIALETDRRRIVFIGDSFTEGVGMAYGDSFVGLVDAALADRPVEVLNAGVVSYCPLLYRLKVQYLLEEVGLRFDQLYVFIDISDIQDEIVYQGFEPQAFPLHRHVDAFLKRHSYTYGFVRNNYALLYEIRSLFGEVEEVMQPDRYAFGRSRWTYDDDVFAEWGARGLELAQRNMDQLVALCRDYGVEVVIAVYPWPDQLVREEAAASIQARSWREFAAAHQVGFIDYFPVFATAGAPADVRDRYFIAGDSHWNAAGHRLIAGAVVEHILARGGTGL